MMRVLSQSVVPETPDWPGGWKSVLTHTHTWSGRSDHGGALRPPESYRNLAAFAAKWRIDALAMGSNYTPATSKNFDRYDEDEHEAYFRAGFDRQAVMDREEIQRMLDEVNAIGGGRTLFFLDNETPKGRYGHMWWLGHRPDSPAWHDYDRTFDRWMVRESIAGDANDEPQAYERRPYMQIVASQRAQGALGFWAHPTSWWTGDKGQFITNIASEMPAHLMADGYLDGLVVMGYQPYRPQYLALWHELLDRGYRVPGVAEMDIGLSDEKLAQRDRVMLNYAPAGSVAMPELIKAFRAGSVFASSGPFVEIEVDGKRMGEVAATAEDRRHRVTITIRPAPATQTVDAVELIGLGGRVIWRGERLPACRVEVEVAGLLQRGYLIAQVFGEGSLADMSNYRAARLFAVSNPVYLHPPKMTFNPPAITRVSVSIAHDSPWSGGRLELESAAGERIDGHTARPGVLRVEMPASGRVSFIGPDGRRRIEYLINANPDVAAAQRYLYRGKFLRAHPDLRAGELPPHVWRLDSFAAALREVRIEG